MRDVYLLSNNNLYSELRTIFLIHDLTFTEALVIMFKNKYSSFIIELEKQFLFWMDLLVTKG